MESDLRELIFELGDAAAPKLCFAVADDTQRWQIAWRIKSELTSQRIPHLEIRLSPQDTDLLETMKSKVSPGWRGVLVVDGFEDMGTRPLTALLTQLNFRRDILFELSEPLLFLVSPRVLSRVVELAPDFWSRRTATYYFMQPSVRDILTRLFRERGTPLRQTSSIPDALQRILAAEEELNRGIGEAPLAARAVSERAMNAISGGVRRLVDECTRGRRAEVALALWTLSRMDELLQQAVSSIPSEVRSQYSYIYEDRNEVLLEMADRVARVLARYLEGVQGRIEKKRTVSLRRLFFADARKRVQAWSRRVSQYYDRLGSDAISLEDVRATDDETELEGIEEDDEPRFVEERERWVAAPDLEAEFGARAAEELRAWLEGERIVPPRVFNQEEADLLVLLYRESPELHELAFRLGRSVTDVETQVEELRAKVHLYLGLPPIAS